MTRSTTRAAYLKRIEDALLDQQRRVSTSKEEAKKLIDSLGIRHLLVPIEKTKMEKRAASNVVPKKNVTK